jgi:hypothetical protein
MIMTQDKARKTATRQRMAATGEPYSVARRAAQSGRPAGGDGEQVFVRYRLARTFEMEIDKDAWAEADDGERARLIAESTSGPAGPGSTLGELIAEDLRVHGARAYTVTTVGATGSNRDEATARDWEEEYYADGAASEGITVAEFKAREAPDHAQERADQAQEHADGARERADLAQDRAEEAQGQAMEARDRADEMRDLVDEARDDVIAATEDADQEELARAERAVIRAAREAELADREADRAQELADQAEELADQAQEMADEEQERANREQDRADDLDGRPHHPRPGMFRPPSPPRPAGQMRLPRAPRLPRSPRMPRAPRMPRLPRLPG